MDSGGRKVFIGGNWKCNGDILFAKNHCRFLNSIQFDNERCEVAVSPVFIHLPAVLSNLDKKFIVSAQDVSMFENGAYTGEVSAKQLKDIGVNWALIGHSERREYFDSDESVEVKTKVSLSNGLSVIVCIGEKLSDREANKTMEVIKTQLLSIRKKVEESQWDNIVVAYEPVWAIGTGKTASPDQAQEVHQEIRKWLAENVSQGVAIKVRIIYGGSVNEKNCNDLIKQKDIDGFLVGGASLKEAFKTIIESYKSK